MAGDFDTVKIGVVDSWWTPAGTNLETYLGLTKGGVTLTYTPEWHDITVDQYGKTPVDESLVGETCVVKIPLAETDLDKIKMFAHTGTWDDTNKKITFGRYPGFRLSEHGGKLRLHPIAFGSDNSEDVTLYRAVNKGSLELNYKMDEERIYQTQFNAMIVRGNTSGAFLFEIGQSGTTTSALKPDLSNLETLFQATGNDIQINPTTLPMIYGTADTSQGHASSLAVTVSCVYNFTTYDITQMVKYTIGDAVCNSANITDSGNPASVITIGKDATSLKDNGVFTAKATAVLTTFMAGASAVKAGDVLTIPVTIAWAGKSHVVNVQLTV